MIMQKLWNTLRRWRTWLVNVVFAILLSPELINALLGFDWATIIPRQYMPYVSRAVIILNVWMRPRAAALPSDPEVKVREVLKRTDGPAHVEVKAGGVTKAVIR
jgi:hypothetical protein